METGHRMYVDLLKDRHSVIGVHSTGTTSRLVILLRLKSDADYDVVTNN